MNSVEIAVVTSIIEQGHFLTHRKLTDAEQSLCQSLRMDFILASVISDRAAKNKALKSLLELLEDSCPAPEVALELRRLDSVAQGLEDCYNCRRCLQPSTYALH